MAKIIMVTGGARSGKSTFAENLVKETGKEIVYIATAVPTDEGMKDRIKKHKEKRPFNWNTIEQYMDFESLEENKSFKECDTILLDCITVLITNLMVDSGINFDSTPIEAVNKLEELIKRELEKLINVIRRNNKNIIIVTNEVGMGIVPAYMMANYFRDIAGRMNQYLAMESDEVYVTISGLSMKLK